MDLTLDQEKYAKNIYVIRRKLSEIKRRTYQNYFEYRVGKYNILIRTTKENLPIPKDDNITKHLIVDVWLYDVISEEETNTNQNYIDLRTDLRFCNYEPIQYNFFDGPNGQVHLGSDGSNMPVTHLCELISYLHRLSKLSAFL